MGFIFSSSLFLVGSNYHASELTNENQNIEKLFESNGYDEVNKKYGVTGMGVGQSEKILSVGIHDIKYKDEVQQYIEKYLLKIGITNYKIEVFVYED